MELTSGVDNETAALAWLVSALEQARRQDQTKLVVCLETIADDVVFEIGDGCTQSFAALKDDAKQDHLIRALHRLCIFAGFVRVKQMRN